MKDSGKWESIRSSLQQQQRHCAITRRAVSDPVPLSDGQKRLWFVDKLAKQNHQSHIYFNYELSTSYTENDLRLALTYIASRHEALTAYVFSKGGNNQLQFDANMSVPFEFVDLSQCDRSKTLRISELENQHREHRFNLYSPPLWKITLIKVSKIQYLMLGKFHHFIFDRWSAGLLLQELTLFLTKGKEALSNSGIQFGDYLVWQQANLAGQQNQLIQKWANVFGQPIPRPANSRNPHETESVDCSRLELTLSLTQTNKIYEASRISGKSCFVLFLSAYAKVVEQITASNDLVINTPVSGRVHRSLNKTVGYFSNLSTLRFTFSQDMNLREVLDYVSRRSIQFSPFQNLPFHKLYMQPELLNHIGAEFTFGYHNTPSTHVQDRKLKIAPFRMHNVRSSHLLSFGIIPENNAFRINIIYNTDRFSKPNIDRLVKNYQSYLDTFISALHS